MKEYNLNIFSVLKIAEEEIKYGASAENTIKWVKGNMPIDNKLFNKYNNVELIFKQGTVKRATRITPRISETNLLKVKTMSENEVYHLAVKIVKNNNDKNIFLNNKQRIIISNGDIKESINKIYRSKFQRIYLLEHLEIFANIKTVIKNATLVSQSTETKNRVDNTIWSYYLTSIIINKTRYLVEFDVISRKDGENHYRVQRIQKKQ